MANNCKYMIVYIFFSCSMGFIAPLFFVWMNIYIYGSRDVSHNYPSFIIFNGYLFVGVEALLFTCHLHSMALWDRSSIRWAVIKNEHTSTSITKSIKSNIIKFGIFYKPVCLSYK